MPEMMKCLVFFILIYYLGGLCAYNDYSQRRTETKHKIEDKSFNQKFLSEARESDYNQRRTRTKNKIEDKSIDKNFPSEARESEKPDAWQTVTFNITKGKNDKKEFTLYVLKHSKLRVIFNSNYYINLASFSESNSTATPTWIPPYNICDQTTHRMHLSSGNSILIDFTYEINERTTTNWTLITLNNITQLCEGKQKTDKHCEFLLTGTFYLKRMYLLLLKIVGVKVSINNETLIYNHIFPQNYTYTYEYEYRPNKYYNIDCSYEGFGSVRSQLIEECDGPPTPVTQFSLYLPKNACNLHCVFNIDNGTVIARAIIKFKYIAATDLIYIKINNNIVLNSKTLIANVDDSKEVHHVYYDIDQKLNVTCIKNQKHCQKYNCHMSCHLYNSGQHRAGKENMRETKLTKNDNGTKIECSYTYGDVKTTIVVLFVLKGIGAEYKANVTLLVNSKSKEDGDTTESDAEFRINCLSSYEYVKTGDISVLRLYKNHTLLVEDKQDENKIYMQKEKEIMYLNATSLLTLAPGEQVSTRCSLEEKTLGVYKPYPGLSKSVTLKRLQIPDTTDTPTTELNGSGDDNSDAFLPNANQGIIGKSWFIPVVACFGIIIIVMIACIIKVSRNTTRDTEELVTAEYDHPNETPPPNFPQTASLEETYCNPFDDNNSENPYAAPYVPKNPEDLYSKPLPKRLRKHQSEVLYATLNLDSNYAKVKPENQKNSPDEPTYAIVGEALKEPAYASVDRSEHYANVSDNSRYANSGGSEYVEPSYCEVGVKKKK